MTKAGKISRIVAERGFGFITADDAPSVDYFFNVRAMHAASRGFHTLKDGDRVSFTATLSEKGPRAIDVRAD